MKIILSSPRGFCAGVDRAIQVVELALERYGAPVYVRHGIVHNRRVIEGLSAKGAVFVGSPSTIMAAKSNFIPPSKSGHPRVAGKPGVVQPVNRDIRNRISLGEIVPGSGRDSSEYRAPRS